MKKQWIMLLGLVVLMASCTQNIAPVAADDTAVTDAGKSVTINVAKNDSDEDGKIDRSSIAVLAGDIKGKAVVENKMVKYTPAAGFIGKETFNYIISDNGEPGPSKTDTGMVTIDVQAVTAVMISTDFGDMKAVLYNQTPQHRDNFIKLANEGFYDGTLFHRVISDFMIQGGDPNSKNAEPGQPLGSGGPGYQIPAEFVETLFHKKGALSAARQGDAVNPQKKSSGSQFYVVQGSGPMSVTQLEQQRVKEFRRDTYSKIGGTPFLDDNYTVFGEVVEGLDVIDKIAAVQKGPGDRPVEDVKMTVSVIK